MLPGARCAGLVTLQTYRRRLGSCSSRPPASIVGPVSDGWAILSALAATVGALVAVASAVAAWVSSVRAKKDRVRAEQAKAESLALTRQFVAAAESQAESQRIMASRVEGAVPRVSRWSEARNVKGRLYSVRNLGDHEVQVLSVSTVPAEASELLTVRTPVPGPVPPGGELRFFALARWGLSIQSITVSWSVEDEIPQETVISID